MFTGIIEQVGQVRAREPLGGGVRFVIESELASVLVAGESIGVNGVCLTVTALAADAFVVEAVATTLGRTTLGALSSGRRVNLERALAFGGRVGGHLVQGHVDGVGTVVDVRREEEHVLVDIRMPPVVAQATVLHGSIAIDGVSMTVNALPAEDVVQVSIIPFTWDHTTFSELAPGVRVNLEGDMFGKYVVAWLERTATAERMAGSLAGEERG
jgi:riboflavin synthase